MATTALSPRHTEGFFTNARDKKLFYTAFFPANSATNGVQGVVLFMHGINEHCHRFTHVYDALVSLGFGVIAYDMIGHGKSDDDVPGIRQHSEEFQNMVDDTNAFLTFAKQTIYTEMLPVQQQLPPLFYTGISYGCLVGMHTILSHVHEFSGVVLSAPAIGIEQSLAIRVLSFISAPLLRMLPHAKIVPGIDFNDLSRDPVFVQDFQDDKLNGVENMTARMGTYTLEAMQQIQEDKTVEDKDSFFCGLPILVIQGTADAITSGARARAFFDRIANADKQMKEYEGLYHCLYNEPEKDRVIGDVTSWLATRARQLATKRATAEGLPRTN